MNFKEEIFPNIEMINSFDHKIKAVEGKIADCLSVKDTLHKDNQNLIPEVSGAYFFYDGNEIVYVGISRKLKFRLQQHTNHKSSNSASLAYLMAKKELKNKYETISLLKACFEKADTEVNCRKDYQNKIKDFKVAFVKIEDNFELALFEIYAAIKLKCYWNSFRTH